jgi:antitoxin component of MazEF toxin-antitoxin module
MKSTDRSVTFETTLAAFGNNTGIVVPPEAIAQLDAGRRPAVEVDVNGHHFRTTVGVMGGQHLVSISAARRGETGLAAGDPVEVTLVLDTTPRAVEMPIELAQALTAQPAARAFFDSLPNSLQRYHADQVASAKGDETRRRRVDKAIALFIAGKKR